MPLVDVKQNAERAVLQALKESGIQSIPLTLADLQNAVSTINAISTLAQAKAVLLKLLKVLAFVYIEFERHERDAAP